MIRTIEDFCCLNEGCSSYGKRGNGNLSFRGWSGSGKRIRMIYCNECKKVFSERKGTVLEQARLKEEKVESIIEHLVNGCGTRATGRLVKVSNGTVSRYIKKSGEVAMKFHDEKVSFSPRIKRDTI